MNLIILAEYSNIFALPINKVELVKNIEPNSFFIVLSKLGYYRKYKDKEKIDKLLRLLPQIEFLDNIDNYISSHELISRQGILGTWKTILSQPINILNTKSLIPKENFMCALKLILYFNENFEKSVPDDEADQINYLFSSAYFHYFDDLYHIVSRVYYMFVKNKYENLEISANDINSGFKYKYGLSLYDYICATYALCCTFDIAHIETIDRHDYLRAVWPIDSNKVRITSKICNVAWNNFFSMISFEYNEGNKWAIESKDRPTDYELFKDKPLYRINEYLYIPVERKFLNDLLFLNLINKITNCKNGNIFLNNLGYMFQQYLEYIIDQFVKSTYGKYNYINEFEYFIKDNETNKTTSNYNSPDIIIVHNNIVLIIEVKSSRIPNQVSDYVESTYDINQLSKRFVFSPLKQAVQATHSIVFNNIIVKCTDAVKQTEATKRIKGMMTDDKVYYFMTVSMTNFPYQNFDAKDFIDDIKKINKKNKMKYGGFYSINIEEFELFIKLLCQKNAKPISWYLEYYRKMKNKTNLSFKSFYLQTKKEFIDFDNINNPISQLGVEAVDWINSKMH